MITSNTSVCVLLSLMANYVLTPFLSPLALLFMNGKLERGCAMLLNSMFSFFHGLYFTSYSSAIIFGGEKAKTSYSAFSGSLTFTMDNMGREAAILTLSIGLVSLLLYSLPQLLYGIKLVREGKKAPRLLNKRVV